MAYLVRAGGPEGVAWVAARSGFVPTRQAVALVACRPDGVVRAGVALDGWVDGGMVQMHAASESPVAWRRLVPALGRYVFREARRHGRDATGSLLFAAIRSDNVGALRMATHAGMGVEHRLRGAFGAVDLVFLSLRRAEWEAMQPPERQAA